jgi:hypothetical protein
MRVFAVLLGAVLILAGTMAVASAQQPTRLTIEVSSQVRTGEAEQVTVLLTDARGAPLAGEFVTVYERVSFFDYSGTARLAELRTDYRGMASLTYVAAAPGRGQLTAEYPGSERYAPSTTIASIRVETGPGVVTGVAFERPAPLLPRGVTAAWFLPLLIGVWLAIATAVYQVVRIPVERRRTVPAPDRGS